MNPLSFDQITSRECVGDKLAREIEAKARADADVGNYSPPKDAGGKSYWSQCQSSFEFIVYHAQYEKRLARNKRKADALE